MTRRFLLFLIISLVLISCGGGSGSSTSQLSEAELNKYYNFVEFLVQEKLTPEDKQMLADEMYAQMQANPEATRQYLNSIFTIWDSVLKYDNDLATKGVWRSYAIGVIYMPLKQASQQSGQKFALQKIVEKYSPVLAYDPKTNLVYTEKDHKGLMEYFRFGIEKILKKQFNLTPKIENEFKTKIPQNFANLDFQGKALFACMGIYGNNYDKVYENASPEEKQKIMQSFAQTFGVNPASGGSYNYAMDDFTFKTMQNILQIQHETNLSIIQNIGSPNWKYEYEYDY